MPSRAYWYGALAGDVVAVEAAPAPAVGAIEPGAHARDRRLARAVRAEQREHAARRAARARRRRSRGTARSRRRRRAARAAAPTARRRRAAAIRRCLRGRPCAPRRRRTPRRSGPTRSACRSRARRPAATKLRTSSTSCSTSRIAMPVLALHRRAASSASSSVSWRSRPDDGSSSSTSFGSVISARPISTSRPTPRLSASTGGRRPRRGRAGRASPAARCLLVRGRAGPRNSRSFHSAPLPLRTRSATRKCSRGVMPDEQLDALERARDPEPGPPVRRHPREVAARRTSPCRRRASSMPSRQLKNVVLPAPFGPMSPTISPSSTSRLTSSSAVMPANVFVTPCALEQAHDAPPAGAAAAARAGVGGRVDVGLAAAP